MTPLKTWISLFVLLAAAILGGEPIPPSPTPTLGGETFTDEVVRRAARQGAPEAPPTATKTASKR